MTISQAISNLVYLSYKGNKSCNLLLPFHSTKATFIFWRSYFFVRNKKITANQNWAFKKAVLLLSILIRIDVLISWLQWNEYLLICTIFIYSKLWTYDSVNISKSALLKKNIFRDASGKVRKITISVNKNRFVFFLIEILKKIVSTYLHCFNVATQLIYP